MDALNISGLVSHHAHYRPNDSAVVFGNQRLSWHQLEQRSNHLAHALRVAGVGHGDRVVTVLANSVELIYIYWACARLGAVAVPLSPLLMSGGLQTLLADAEPKIIFVSAATQALCTEAKTRLASTTLQVLVGERNPDDKSNDDISFDAFMGDPPTEKIHAAVVPDDLFNIMYTSGTTGLPKGIALTHRIRAHYATLMANAWRMDAQSVVLHSGALVFNGAFVTMMPALLVGCRFVLQAQFDPVRFIETVEREAVTHTMLVPSQIAAILDSPSFDAGRLASLQMLVSLGAPLPVAQKERLETHLPGRFYELYGLTEGFVTILDRQDALRKRGSVGVPPPFSSLRIVREDGTDANASEIGEIAGRSPLLMPGYYRRPELTAQTIRDGWLFTGDLGYVDDDGYLFLVDRKKDMIDSGGVKIYPRDIEEIMARHPDVAEAVVFGVPHEKWGETPLAAVQLRPRADGSAANADELRSWINARVAARYQQVSAVSIVVNFPRNAAGKILKRELRDPHWAGRERLI